MKKSLFVFGALILALASCNDEPSTPVDPNGNTNPEDTVSIYDETGCLYTSYEGLVMCGYQGWFNAEGDGADRGWNHYCGANRKFEPGISTIDFWPDMTEYEDTYETAFFFADGTKAHVFSPHDYSTIDLHFKWMKEYGIDGIYAQRFVTTIKDTKGKYHMDTVLDHMLTAAKKYGRTVSIMYDLSGSSSVDMAVVEADWNNIVATHDLFNAEKHPTYLRHNGRPLLALWGIGFGGGRNYTCSDVLELQRKLKSSEQPVSILLGVPYQWRELGGDTDQDETLLTAIKEADVIMPWAVGRYNNSSYESTSEVQKLDQIWCRNYGILYVPLVFPGFTWGNLQNDVSLYNQIPRLEGDFFWKQVAGAVGYGAKALYVAMFDEIDEGTAIFKCLNEEDVPLNGDEGLKFVGIDNTLETDHYLWLVGEATKWIRGEGNYNTVQPKR